MFRKMTYLVIVCLALIGGLPAAGQPLKMEQALSMATARVEREDSRLPLLEAQVRLLNSMAKRRFEFRPNLGLFSFSSPAILAATIGSGLVYQNSRVSPQTLQAATYDLLSARIARERAKVRGQIEAARTFFSLVEKQELEAARCDAAALRQRQQQQVGQSVKSGDLTALDLASFQHVAIDAEWVCTEARTERKMAALKLAAVLGRDDPDFGPVAQPELRLASHTQALPTENAFHQMALKFREDMQWIDRELLNLKKPVKRTMRSRLSGVPGSVDYRYVTHTAGSRTPDFLLGGNTVHLQLPWNVPLTKSTERDAEQLLAAARIEALESEAIVQRREMRQEVNSLVVEAQAAKERIELARRKRDLTRESHELLAARVQGGLSGDVTLSMAALEAAEQASESSLLIANQHWRAALYSLYVACGIHERPEVAMDLMKEPAETVLAAVGGGK